MAIGLIAVLCSLLIAPSLSLAHERRTIGGGKYDVVVGWDTEPAYVNQKNAASVRISRAGTNPAEPVTGAEKTLKVEIRQGAQTKSFDLRAAFGSNYRAAREHWQYHGIDEGRRGSIRTRSFSPLGVLGVLGGESSGLRPGLTSSGAWSRAGASRTSRRRRQ